MPPGLKPTGKAVRKGASQETGPLVPSITSGPEGDGGDICICGKAVQAAF
jgi:hypothetical protein